MLTTPARFSSLCTKATNAAWQRTKEKSGPRRFPSSSSSSSQRRTSFTGKPVVSPLLFFSVHLLPHPLPYGMVSMETEVVQKKKSVSVSEFFSSVFLSLPPLVFVSLVLSLSRSACLRRSLKVKQCAERSISLINTTQQHSALRGEMKRHGGMSTCRPGVVLTNDTYHTSHG